MEEIYDVEDGRVHIPFQKSSETDYNIISMEIPDNVSDFGIDGSQPRIKITTGGLIFSIILIGSGIGVLIALMIKKVRFDDLRE